MCMYTYIHAYKCIHLTNISFPALTPTLPPNLSNRKTCGAARPGKNQHQRGANGGEVFGHIYMFTQSKMYVYMYMYTYTYIYIYIYIYVFVIDALPRKSDRPPSGLWSPLLRSLRWPSPIHASASDPACTHNARAIYIYCMYIVCTVHVSANLTTNTSTYLITPLHDRQIMYQTDYNVQGQDFPIKVGLCMHICGCIFGHGLGGEGRGGEGRRGEEIRGGRTCVSTSPLTPPPYLFTNLSIQLGFEDVIFIMEDIGVYAHMYNMYMYITRIHIYTHVQIIITCHIYRAFFFYQACRMTLNNSHIHIYTPYTPIYTPINSFADAASDIVQSRAPNSDTMEDFKVVCVSVCTCMYTYIFIYVYMYVCMCICAYMYMYVYCLYVCM